MLALRYFEKAEKAEAGRMTPACQIPDGGKIATSVSNLHASDHVYSPLLLDGDAGASTAGGRSQSIKFQNSPNDQNCSVNLKAVITIHHSTDHQPNDQPKSASQQQRPATQGQTESRPT
jgi:hypothetical protein